MSQEKEARFSYFTRHFTTIISVTLVLLLAGTITLVSLGAKKETRRLQERLEVSLVMADTVGNAYAESLAARIAAMKFAKDVNVVSREQALEDWKKDTGEDLEELFGVNPLSPEITFNVMADYASETSLDELHTRLVDIPGVEEVIMPDSEMVEAMNSNIEAVALTLGLIAIVMVVISFVLINNTVHLSIYARRFTIHTMQLVGATNGFIRRPIVLSNMSAGIIAGLLASGILAIGIVWAPAMGFPHFDDYVSWPIYAAVAGGLVVVGAGLCGAAAAIATTRYLRKDYEDLFK